MIGNSIQSRQRAKLTGVLLSINPKYIKEIQSGAKQNEFRKQIQKKRICKNRVHFFPHVVYPTPLYRSSIQTAPNRPVFLQLEWSISHSEAKTGTSGKTTPKTPLTGRSPVPRFREKEFILTLDGSFLGTLGEQV